MGEKSVEKNKTSVNKSIDNQTKEDNSNDMMGIKEKEAGDPVEKDNINEEITSGPTQNAEEKEEIDESSQKEMSTTKTKVEADEESKIPSEEDDSNDIVSIKEKVAGVSIEKDNVSKEIGSDQSQNVEKKGNANESNKKEMSTTKTEVEADDRSKIPSDEDHLNDMVSIKEKEVEKDCANEEIGSDPTQNAEKKDDTDKSSKEKMSLPQTELEADEESKICSDEDVIEPGVLHLVVVE